MNSNTSFYQLLGDKTSKDIYNARLNYIETSDPKYLREMVLTNKETHFMKEIGSSNKRVLMYSAGIRGRRVVKAWDGIKWEAFIDSDKNKENTIVDGMPVLSVEKALADYSNDLILIPNRVGWNEIEANLLNNGVKSERIINIGRIWSELMKKQYFDLPYISYSKQEVFVDCGYYDGETTKEFIRRCNGEFSHVYGFEPDISNIKKAKSDNLIDDSKVTLFNKCVWDKVGTVPFLIGEDMGAKISQEGNDVISTTTIDNEFSDTFVSFIKMDVEGAELKALCGSRKVIESCFPKMAICIYHKPEDIVDIPEFFMEYRNKYSFYIRHYSFAENETVLYAIPK